MYEKVLEKLVFDECFAQVADHRGPDDSTWLIKERNNASTAEITQVCEANREIKRSQHNEMHDVNE